MNLLYIMVHKNNQNACNLNFAGDLIFSLQNKIFMLKIEFSIIQSVFNFFSLLIDFANSSEPPDKG